MKYRLTFLTTGLAVGGAETQLVRLATHIDASSFDINITSMLRPEYFLEDLNNKNIYVNSLDMRRGVPDPRALVKTIKMLQHYRPHILICFMFHANLLGRLAGKIAGVPIIISSIRNENMGGGHAVIGY